MWRAYTTKEKAILLELLHLALFQAGRRVTPAPATRNQEAAHASFDGPPPSSTALARRPARQAERYMGDVCSECLPAAKRMPRASWELPGTPGPSCSADYFTGAPRVEACNVTGDGWGGKPPCGEHCGRLKILCPVTKNDYELELDQASKRLHLDQR